MEKLKVGIFEGPQIRELVNNPMFDETLSETEISVRKSLKSVVTNFLENCQSVECKKEIKLKSFCQPGV